MSTALQFVVNGSNLTDVKEKATPIIQHFFELEDRDPFDTKSLEISIDAQPLPSPDAVIRTFIADVTVVKA